MNELWLTAKNIIFQWVLPIAGFLGLIYGWRSYRIAKRSQKNRKLKFECNERALVFSSKLTEKDSVDFRLNGERVRNLYFLEFTITNIGNEVLYAKDFREPFQIEFPGEINIFPLRIERDKNDINITYDIKPESTKTTVTINTELVEPKDKIIFTLLYEATKYAGYVPVVRIIDGNLENVRSDWGREESSEDIEARIRKKYERRSKLGDLPVMIMTGLFCALIALPVYIIYPDFFADDYEYSIIRNIIIGCVALIVLSGVMRYALRSHQKWFNEFVNEKVDEAKRRKFLLPHEGDR